MKRTYEILKSDNLSQLQMWLNQKRNIVLNGYIFIETDFYIDPKDGKFFILISYYEKQ